MTLEELIRQLADAQCDIADVVSFIAKEEILPEDLYQAMKVERSDLVKLYDLNKNNIEQFAKAIDVHAKTVERWLEGSSKILPKYWSRIRKINDDEFIELRDACAKNGPTPAHIKSFFQVEQEATAVKPMPANTAAPVRSFDTKIGEAHRETPKTEQNIQTGAKSMTGNVSLAAAAKSFDAKVNDIHRAANGIQFLLYAYYHKKWQPHTSTGLRAGTYPARGQNGDLVHFIDADDARGRVRKAINAKGREIFQQMKVAEDASSTEVSEPVFDDGVEYCPDIPEQFVDEFRYRFIYKPKQLFLFLAGGIGPDQVQRDWLVFSPQQVDPKDQNNILKELDRFREAFAARYP
jgi:hypothetical protein